MISYEEFSENCRRLIERVETAAQKSGRARESVKILPVTKTHPIDAALYCSKYGFASVGENRVQEALDKMGKIPPGQSCPEWELIGHLQSNKAKRAVENFSRIQSVDSAKLLRKINAEASSISKIQRVLIQVNAGRDPAKFGVDIEEAPELLAIALECKSISVEGLMTIAPLDSDLKVATACFNNLRNLRDKLQRDFSIALPELSMGMSGDLEAAIGEGSTMIRVGTFLFGSRGA